MAATYPGLYRYNPCAGADRRDDLPWNQDPVFERHVSVFDMSRSPSVQPPMQRYLQESGRPLFTSKIYEEDHAMHPFPNVPWQHMESGSPLYSLPYRYASPSNSGLSSSQFSSTYDDKEPTPWSSPDMSATAYSPETYYTEHSLYSAGGYASYDSHENHHGSPCVTLHDVQGYADAQPEIVHYDDDHLAYGTYAQEGYHPMEDAQSTVPVVPSQSFHDDTPNGVIPSQASPVLRRRRTQSTRSIVSPHQASKITKRPTPSKRASSYHGGGGGKAETNGNSVRAFPCPFATYGCAATFGSKNEWKRHVHTQHMRLGFWRCDQCPNGERKPNDFNRKDLFIQHVRRMHPVTVEGKKAVVSKSKNGRGTKNDSEEEVLAEISKRCYRILRSPPAKSGCLFCDDEFESWDERMEHVGRHMEASKKSNGDMAGPDSWRTDETTQDWLLKEGLIVKQKGHLRLGSSA